MTDGIRLGTESRNGVNQKQGPGIVPLDRKRRIFRPPTLSLPRGGPSLPNRATAVAVLGCVAILSAGIWLLGHPSEAPANAPETGVLAATASGVAVLDGSTLRLGDRVVRLDGLTAPERGDLCPGAGPAETDCGAAAANALAGLVRDTRVECNWKGRTPSAVHSPSVQPVASTSTRPWSGPAGPAPAPAIPPCSPPNNRPRQRAGVCGHAGEDRRAGCAGGCPDRGVASWQHRGAARTGCRARRSVVAEVRHAGRQRAMRLCLLYRARLPQVPSERRERRVIGGRTPADGPGCS